MKAKAPLTTNRVAPPVTGGARQCSVCGRALIQRASIRAGMGRICATKAARGATLAQTAMPGLGTDVGPVSALPDDAAASTADEGLPDWEQLLNAAARLQNILPDATLVGGTAAALVAGHRRSLDADHVIAGLVGRFDEVLAELESAAGWRTARRQRPVVIKGSLDGILTTVRNLRRTEPLETFDLHTPYGPVRLPVAGEILRIKAWLVVDRNATRDFFDVAAISAKVGLAEAVRALASLDRLYPQEGDSGAVRQQLMRQLAEPRPYDLEGIRPRLAQYKDLAPRWQAWPAVEDQCRALGLGMAEAVATRRAGWTDV